LSARLRKHGAGTEENAVSGESHQCVDWTRTSPSLSLLSHRLNRLGYVHTQWPEWGEGV